MIGKELRGWRPSGLVRYLFGPERSGLAHEDPRVVASWDGDPGGLQPAKTGPGEFDFDLDPLIAHLEEPAREAGLPVNNPSVGAKLFGQHGPVWHTPLRAAPDDRVLSDGEWREIAEHVMAHVGIAEPGDAGAPRWIAVRHDDESIHLVAMLVRQDTGKRVHPKFSKRRLREACQQVEQRYGITATASADRTAAARASRGETEKAERQQTEPTRYELAERVARCAATADSESAFLEGLQRAGLQVRTRTDEDGAVTGYAVASPSPRQTAADGGPVWYAGRRLSPDLSWPQLQARWSTSSASTRSATASTSSAGSGSSASSGSSAGAVSRPGSTTAAERAAVVDQSRAAVEHARTALRNGSEEPAGIAHATADVLRATGAVSEPRRQGPWSETARRFDRASRASAWREQQLGAAARELRVAAWAMGALDALGGRSHEERGSLAALVAATSSLLLELAAWHAAAQRSQQAQAAHAAAAAVPSTARGGPAPSPTQEGPGRGPQQAARPGPWPGPRPPRPR